jgi:hypothetical protein
MIAIFNIDGLVSTTLAGIGDDGVAYIISVS